MTEQSMSPGLRQAWSILQHSEQAAGQPRQVTKADYTPLYDCTDCTHVVSDPFASDLLDKVPTVRLRSQHAGKSKHG